MERNYATQMDAARRGIVTPELEKSRRKRVYGRGRPDAARCQRKGCHSGQ